MTAVWLTVIVVGLISMALKAVGPALLGGRELPAQLRNLVTFLAPALLAALIATQIFTMRQQLVVDARVVGLGVGVLALLLRVPALLAVAIAAATTAVFRLAVG